MNPAAQDDVEKPQAVLSDKSKNFIFAVFTTSSIAFVVHFSGGYQSLSFFLYFLIIIAAAAALSTFELIFVGCLAVLFSIVEWAFFAGETANLELFIARVTGLVLVTAFSWYVFQRGEEVFEKEKEKKLAKVREINKVKNEFVYIISNKLKEPVEKLEQYLASAANYSKSISANTKDLLGKTRENSSRLRSLVEDLSDLTKIESGRLHLEIAEVDLGQVIGATLSDFTPSANEKKISLVYQPSKKAIKVKADSGRVHEVLANLVDNAIKYSPSGKEVKISLQQKEASAVVGVADQGFGIPPEAEKHLFEKFFRIEREGQTQIKGTGLGLFITKQLVERQGGKIWFERAAGKGTNFFFSLPLVYGK